MATSETKEYLEGHPEFAAYIAVDPDLQIFRRFTRLTARNLLYLQSELTSLETWFDEFDREDEERLMTASEAEKMDIWLRNKNWETFAKIASNCNSNPTEEEKRQAMKMKQVMKLRRLVEEYQDALTRQHACLSLEEPRGRVLQVFRAWYSHKNPLLGREMEMLDDAKDLISLKKAIDSDRLSSMLRDKTGFLFSYFHKETHGYPPSWEKLYVFRERYVDRLIAVTSVLLAALLLVGSITTLYFERRPGVRLGLVGVFTFIFAASVGLLTSANRGDLFAATAAYAAVLVVFVSGGLGA